MSEWFKEPVLKTGVPARVPWVRIPPLPPSFQYLVETNQISLRRLSRRVRLPSAVLQVETLAVDVDAGWRRRAFTGSMSRMAVVAGLRSPAALALARVVSLSPEVTLYRQ